MSKKEIIALDNVTFIYAGSDRPAVKNVSLTINRGDFLGVVGRSGSGKTTLCYLLNGIIPHFKQGKLEGDVICGGLNTKHCKPYELAGIVGTVMEDPESQILDVTVRDEVSFSLMDLSEEEIERRVLEALTIVGLREMEDKSPWNLSGGQKQRLALASVLAKQPEVLILDEPTAWLDPVGTTEVFNVISRLSKEYHKTVVMTEQKVEYLAEFADRIVVMDRGEIRFTGRPKEIFKERQFVESYGVFQPQVVELFNKLKMRSNLSRMLPSDPPLTLGEAYRIFRNLLEGLQKCS